MRPRCQAALRKALATMTISPQTMMGVVAIPPCDLGCDFDIDMRMGFATWMKSLVARMNSPATTMHRSTDFDDSCLYAGPGEDCAGNCLADTDGDGICDGAEVAGCTNDNAGNFNPEATDDDGSCQVATRRITAVEFFFGDDPGGGSGYTIGCGGWGLESSIGTSLQGKCTVGFLGLSCDVWNSGKRCPESMGGSVSASPICAIWYGAFPYRYSAE